MAMFHPATGWQDTAVGHIIRVQEWLVAEWLRRESPAGKKLPSDMQTLALTSCECPKHVGVAAICSSVDNGILVRLA